MNDFVDPKHRGVNLPSGFKDLMDVLAAKEATGAVGSATIRPKIERFQTHALVHAAKYASRFLESKSLRVSLIFSAIPFRAAFALSRNKNSCRASFLFSRDEEFCEKRTREIFAEFGVVPDSDVFVEKAKRVITYLLPDSFPDFITVTTELLRQVYGISDDGSLFVIFHEQ